MSMGKAASDTLRMRHACGGDFWGNFLFVPKLGSGRGTVGKCTGPKWSKRLFWSKWPYSELDLEFARPKWTKMVHFGLKGSILVHLGPPTVLWPFLTHVHKTAEFQRKTLPKNRSKIRHQFFKNLSPQAEKFTTSENLGLKLQFSGGG